MAWPKGRPNPHGGNRKGRPAKATVARQARVAAAAAEGLMPLEFMLLQLRNEELPMSERMHAAATAAPYLHAKLTSIDAKVSGDLRIEVVKFADRKAA